MRFRTLSLGAAFATSAVAIVSFQNFTGSAAPEGSVALSEFLGTKRVTAMNSSGQALAQSFASIPFLAGSKSQRNYDLGYILVAPEGTTYGGTGGVPDSVGPNAIVVVPPGEKGEEIEIRLSNFAQAVSPSGVYNLHFRAGLRSDAPNGVSAVIRSIEVSGQNADANFAVETLPSVELLSEPLVIEPGLSSDLWFPLGLSSRAPDFSIAIHIAKSTGVTGNLYENLVLDEFELWRGPDVTLSVNQANLEWMSGSTAVSPAQRQVIAAANHLEAGYVREVLLDDAGGGNNAIAMMIANQKIMTGNGQKILLDLPGASIFDTIPAGSATAPVSNANAGLAFQNLCGWEQGSTPYAKVVSASLEARLVRYLAQAKAANIVIDAFEIGNEINWVCFNGDISIDEVQDAVKNDMQIDRLAKMKAYGAFLQTAVRVIKSYYPNALIVSPGMMMAGTDVGATNPAGYLFAPGELIAILADLFDSNGRSLYSYFDRIGVHLYPGSGPAGNPADPAPILNTFYEQLGAPGWTRVWITEMGYTLSSYSCAAHPESADCLAVVATGGLNLLSQQRYNYWVKYLHSLLTTPADIIVENIFLYELYDASPGLTSFSLMNSSTHAGGSFLTLQPEAELFFQNYRPTEN